MLQRIIDWFQRVGEWLANFFTWLWSLFTELVYTLFDLLLLALVGVLNLIPVPSWAEGLDLDWVPASMAYFLEPFNIPLALACITGGYLIRFIIRRLPVIG